MIDNRRLATAVLLFCFLSGPAAYAQSSSMGLNAPQLYEKGMNSLLRVGVYRSDINAVDYIRRSAELGYAPAQVLLGYFYDTGNRLSQNSGEAADWYKKAAKQDDHLVLGCWDGSTIWASEFHAISALRNHGFRKRLTRAIHSASTCWA